MTKQHLRMFSRWKCLTHNAGSYNFNALNRHFIENVCLIHEDVTVGVVKPKTFGGVNGDVGRHHYPEWHQLQKLKQQEHLMKDKWSTFLERKRLEIVKTRKNTVAHRYKEILKH